MVKRLSIEFIEATKPINEPVTKFGGQPVWLSEAQWPLSAETGNPMRFICQIALDPTLFGDIDAKMAYIFMTDEEEFVDGTYDMDGGENAVILQPGTTEHPVKALTTGPTLGNQPNTVEFSVKLTPTADPKFAEDTSDWTDEMQAVYTDALQGNKIGGTPGFIQGDEFPEPGEWKLLLQLNSTSDVPFSINFGDSGTAYAFISEDGTQAKFLWQCF
jgi:uncharacterized protein YwqG